MHSEVLKILPTDIDTWHKCYKLLVVTGGMSYISEYTQYNKLYGTMESSHVKYIFQL